MEHPSIDVRDEIWGTDAHLWGPDVRALGLADEMEDVELGERVSWWQVMCLPFYSSEASNCQAMTTAMVGEIAEATSHRGLPFPAEWWPPSAGPQQ